MLCSPQTNIRPLFQTTTRCMITVTASEHHRLPRRYGIGMERADESSFLDFNFPPS